jgi:hypothetical protein
MIPCKNVVVKAKKISDVRCNYFSNLSGRYLEWIEISSACIVGLPLRCQEDKKCFQHQSRANARTTTDTEIIIFLGRSDVSTGCCRAVEDGVTVANAGDGDAVPPGN